MDAQIKADAPTQNGNAMAKEKSPEKSRLKDSAEEKLKKLLAKQRSLDEQIKRLEKQKKAREEKALNERRLSVAALAEKAGLLVFADEILIAEFTAIKERNRTVTSTETSMAYCLR